MRHKVAYDRHKINCGRTFPPGNEIYRKENLSFFEIDGQKHQEYCRNLCLLAKLFLKQKTVHELDQVPAFLFYVLTETDQDGSHIIGYFSKQKADDQCDNSVNTVYNNLSCILILPPYQCRGFGRMLIEMSYILSRLEQRIGTPERPLSDLGIIIYRRYWRFEILKYLSSFTAKSINIRSK
ncbi:Histone acetyltransferase kat7 [Schistosoma haematobium]|uniref:Histone acetyltransferase n=1 Tax=Schistosoma haematobium TaxID=6185 RepID=A0A922LMW5_SCHHA|nr:Histone acetyltransferase kat7 [Schistosoma haematobium]KAH9590007.1 Histone acetyltransferase kat7 [Schistosoma haematobium]